MHGPLMVSWRFGVGRKSSSFVFNFLGLPNKVFSHKFVFEVIKLGGNKTLVFYITSYNVKIAYN